MQGLALSTHASCFADSHSDDAAQPAQKRRRLSPSPRLVPADALRHQSTSESRDENLRNRDDTGECSRESRSSERKMTSIRTFVKPEPIERWFEIEAVYGTPSPPPAFTVDTAPADDPHAIKLVEKNGRAEVQVAAEPNLPADQAAKDEDSGPSSNQTSKSHKASPEPNNKATPSAHSENELQLLQFPGKGKRWSMQCEAALIKFAARDTALRGWAAGDRLGGVEKSINRFCEATGTIYNSVYGKLCTWRDRYDTFNRLLTPAGRLAPTRKWEDPADWSLLASHKATDPDAWLRIWHDELFVEGQSSAGATASPTPATASPPKKRPRSAVLRRDASMSRNSTPSAGTSRLHAASTAPDSPSTAATSSRGRVPGSPAASAQPGPSRLQKRKFTAINSTSSSVDLKLEVEKQARRIELLEEQNRRRSQLLAQQEELIQRATRRAVLQSQTCDQQQESLDRISQRLESLIALATQRR